MEKKMVAEFDKYRNIRQIHKLIRFYGLLIEQPISSHDLYEHLEKNGVLPDTSSHENHS